MNPDTDAVTPAPAGAAVDTDTRAHPPIALTTRESDRRDHDDCKTQGIASATTHGEPNVQMRMALASVFQKEDLTITQIDTTSRPMPLTF